MKRKRSKKKSQFIHAQKRFKQRFGINFSRSMNDFFVSLIQKGKAFFVEKQSCRISIWDIDYDQETFRVVYDKERKSIVTVLYDEKKLKDIQEIRKLLK